MSKLSLLIAKRLRNLMPRNVFIKNGLESVPQVKGNSANVFIFFHVSIHYFFN